MSCNRSASSPDTSRSSSIVARGAVRCQGEPADHRKLDIVLPQQLRQAIEHTGEVHGAAGSRCSRPA
jgi:hypothetical protein